MSRPAAAPQAMPRTGRVTGLVVGSAGLLVVLLVGLLVPASGARGAAQLAVLVPVVLAGLLLRSRAVWPVVAAAVAVHATLVLAHLPAGQAAVDLAAAVVVLVLLGLALDGRAVTHGRRDDAEHLDPLVGVVNRTSGEDVGRHPLLEAADVRELARLAPLGSDPDVLGTGLLIAEPDLLPELVDAHGPPAADAALAHAAEVLRTAVRPGDTVARLGHAELAVLMPGVDAGAVALRAEALRRAVRDTPLSWQGQQVQVTVSVGVAHTAAGHQDLDALHAVARNLLDAAREGRRSPPGRAEPS